MAARPPSGAFCVWGQTPPVACGDSPLKEGAFEHRQSFRLRCKASGFARASLTEGGGKPAGFDGRSSSRPPGLFCAFWQRCRFPVRPLSVKRHLRNDRSRFGDAKLKRILPLNMARVQRRRPPPAAETGRSCWGSGQQDASAAQGTKRMLGAATRRQGLLALDNPEEEVEAQKS
mgnify:CR=1 FL=1